METNHNECPHCGDDLTDEWISVSISWSGGNVTEHTAECPTCGGNMAADVLEWLE